MIGITLSFFAYPLGVFLSKGLQMVMYVLSFLLLAGMLVLPMYGASEDRLDNTEEKINGEETCIWYQAQGFADVVVGQLAQSSIGGRWLGDTYAEHRRYQPYAGNCHLGSPVIFADSAHGGNLFNSTDNMLRFIGHGLLYNPEAKKGLFAAVRDGGCVYGVTTNEHNEVVTIDQQFIGQDKNNPVIFMYDTLFLKREGEAVLRNFGGDELVTKDGQPNGQPVIHKGQLIFKREGMLEGQAAEYVDSNGHNFYENGYPLTEKDVQLLPTIESRYYPGTAVSAVLTGTAGVGVGAGIMVRKALKWGYRKMFGKNRNKKKDDKNQVETSVASTSEKDIVQLEKQQCQPSEPAVAPKDRQPSQVSSKSNDKNENTGVLG